MKKNKRNKIIGLLLGILIVLIIVVSSTYAYWQITKTQETPNDIVAACLDLNLEDKSAAIDLDSAWPISDDEANSLTGYTFTVTNNCNEEVNYIVGLNRVEESNYLQDSSIKVRLDEQSSHVYEELSDVEYADSNNTGYTSRVSKQVSVETIGANGTNEHTIRVWVSEDAPVSEQSKIFQGQVFITGGQGIEVPSCFTIADNGTLLGYDISCGKDVKVPAEINGIKVKEINAFSFNDLPMGMVTGRYGELVQVSGSYEYSEQDTIFFIEKLPITLGEITITSKEQLAELMCEGDAECIQTHSSQILVGLEDYNNYDWSKYAEIEYSSQDMAGEYAISDIEKLDLSDAMYLEKIGSNSFFIDQYLDNSINDTCVFKSDYHGDYYECQSNLKELKLPVNGALSTIGDAAFKRHNLENLTIPSSVTIIGASAFSNGTLKRLVFEDSSSSPSNLTTIESSAFNSNDITGTLIIPKSVTKIDENGFYGNNNLTKVIIKNTEENIHIYSWNFNDTTEIVYDPNYTE